MRSLIVALVVSVAGVAQAGVGTVSALEGSATRTAAGGEATALAEGAEVELGDTLEVKQGNLELTLADESVLVLDEGSQLRIDEARFEALENRRFSARLLLGSLWAHVTKALAGSDAKFEVTTSRAVAGVRGTIFNVDVSGAADAAETEVGVEEGKVAVVRTGPPEGVAAVPPSPGFPAGTVPAGTAPRPPVGTAPEYVGPGESLRVHRGGWERRKFRFRSAKFARYIQLRREKRLHRIKKGELDTPKVKRLLRREAGGARQHRR